MTIRGKAAQAARWTARCVFLPRFLRTPKDVIDRVVNVKDEMQSMGAQSIKERTRLQNVQYLAAPDPKTAFAKLVKGNEWTEPELAVQLRNVRIIKWVSLTLAWAFLCALAAIALYIPFGLVFFSLFGACWVACICFSIQVLKMTLFQVQLQERELISLKALTSRDDFFRRLFL